MATEVIETDKLISRRFTSEDHKAITCNHTEKDIKMDIKENALTYDIYYMLRESVGWNNFSQEQACKAIETAYLNIVSFIGETPIGMARLIGDGIYFTIVDVVVAAEYQGMGYGKMMMQYLIDSIEKEMVQNSRVSIQLLSEKGKEKFYQKMGFKLVPHEFCGPCLRKVIHK